MKMYRYGMIAIAALAFSLSSCTNDEPLVHFQPDIPDPDADYTVLCDFETKDLGFASNNEPMTYGVVSNPHKDDANPSDHVGEVVLSGNAWELIYSTPLPEAFKFTTEGNAKFSVNVFSPKAGAKVYFKLENKDDAGIANEITDVVTTKTGEWETLSYDFSERKLPDNTYHKIILIFDAGVESPAGETWYFDDIRRWKTDPPEPVEPQPEIPGSQMNYCDFETAATTLAFTPFESVTYEIVDNPFKDDDNPSDKVGKFVTGGSDYEFIWSGPVPDPFCFSLYGYKFSMKVYAPKEDAKIYLKLESNSDGSISRQIEAVRTTAANQWVTYTFDFSDPAHFPAGPGRMFDNTFDKFNIMFDAGTIGVTGDVWYFDDIIGPKGAPLVTPLLTDFCTFESDDDQFTDFIPDANVYPGSDGTGDPTFEIIDNPYKTGINTSDKVGHVVTGGHRWEFLTSNKLSTPLQLGRLGAVIKVSVYAPRVATVNLKLYKQGGNPEEVETADFWNNVTVANQWQEITFDFSDQRLSNGVYDQIKLFFDGAESHPGEDWYFDNIRCPENHPSPTLMVRAQTDALYASPLAPSLITPLTKWRQIHFANAAVLPPAESPNGKWCMYARGSGYNAANQYIDQIGLFTQEPATFNPLGPWTECPSNPVLEHGPAGSDDHVGLIDCAPVCGPDGKVRFYYLGFRGTMGVDDHIGALMYREQTDTEGEVFSTPGRIVRDFTGCSDAVYHDGKYYIYHGYGYNGGANLKVDVIVTADPAPADLEQTQQQNILMPGGGPDNFDAKAVNGTRIFRLEGVNKWFMVYQGSARHFDFPDRFHVAYSDDLLTWTKVSNRVPFFTRGEADTWDQGAIWFGEVFEHNNTLYMYYEGWGKVGPVANRDEPYFGGGYSSTGVAKVSKTKFLNWCGLQ